MVLIPKADPPYRGGTLSSHEATLKQHLVATRAILSGVWLAADVPKVREEAIETLLDAMREINALAKTTPPDPVKGSGGTSPKERWYQVMAYIIQVMDGVCRNVEISELNQRLKRVEEELGIAEAKPASTRGKSGTES
jgi:hypothetical protein